MTRATYTPGPWRFAGFRKASNFADHTAIIQADHCNLASVRGGVADEKAVAEANARLIAAAPNLLAKLKACVAELEPYADEDPDVNEPGTIGSTVRAAKAAIAEATGGEV